MSEQQKPWVCPIRAGSALRSPDGDPMATVASCVKESCMLWNQRSQQCAVWCIPDRLADLDETLQNICDKLGGGAP